MAFYGHLCDICRMFDMERETFMGAIVHNFLPVLMPVA